MLCYTSGMKQWLVLIGVATIGAGCSGNVETRVASNGVQSPLAEAYMISTVAETSPELRGAYRLVAAAMAQKGFSLAKEAALHLEITLDARHAVFALGDKNKADGLSPAKKKKPLQSCEDREYRLGVTLTRVRDGSEIYRGRSAEYHCKMPVVDALPMLVNAALADFGNPRGSYVLTRPGRE
jgi:hypothetical protein